MAKLLITLLFISLTCQGKTWQVSDDVLLQHVLLMSQAGDEIMLLPGHYTAPLVINKSLSIQGKDALLDAHGKGHGIVINAPDVSIRNLSVRNWGADIGKLDAGVFIAKQATAAQLINVNLQGPGFGIWADGSQKTHIENCKIQGDENIRSSDRGNGIHLFNVSGAKVINNEVWHTRDGIYIDTSNHNELINNHLHHLRYGVHYMYSQYNIVRGNLTEYTRTGYALMQSHHLTVTDNISRHDESYGILMNFITYSTIKNNRVIAVSQSSKIIHDENSEAMAGAEGKAMFVYNSPFNEISYNTLADSEMAIHITAGSDDNKIHHNNFTNNINQVKYVSNRAQEWSVADGGNYWSDYMGFDLDQDGFGDAPYEPNDEVDKLLWKYPQAKVLFNSPGVFLLRFVERQFPVFIRPGITDSNPLIKPAAPLQASQAGVMP
ncbi:MAG: nitrous oxide reductase family maturation protein NosD [Oceanospirillaceae bacterium]|nr:nitrous oxide reductase family maturation protein NosD [Oceanospirillaceae bacterium]MCP5350273.1 nitrous oxide reductase family maturation protein NosD [Oceanospirillaceae bacterium]